VFNPGNLLRAGKQDRQQGGAERSRKFHESIQYISDWGVNPKVGKHSAWNAVWMRKGCGYFGREIVPPPNPADWFYFHQGAGHRE
jgi:hypothetical protein